MNKYLMTGSAALLFGMVLTGCSHDLGEVAENEQAAMENAISTLGFVIPADQDWKMSAQGTAEITVNGDYDATYEVIVYQNNPFVNNEGTVLTRGSVKSGGKLVTEFTYPKGLTTVFATIKDAKGYSYMKPAVISNGKIITSFGGNDAASARTRSAAVTRSEADNFTIPTYSQPDFSDYINDAVAITTENNTTNPSNTVRHYVIPAGTTWNDNIPLIQASDPNDYSIVSVYVLGTLNINNEQRINGGYGGAFKLIVGNGGVVNIASGATLRSQANQGSGYVGEIHVMAGGTIQGQGKMEFANGTNSYNYNGGTINVGTINCNGGTLYNANVLEADVMEGGAGLSVYINQGKVHIGKCVRGSSTANTRILNNCWWEVDEELYCRNIVQGVGAYIKADDLGMSGSEDGTGDAAYIYAKQNSLIDITNYVAFNNIIIDGPTGSGYAYLQCGEATGRSEFGDALGITMNYSTEWINGYETITTPITNNIRLSVDRPQTQSNVYSQTAYEVLLNMLNGTRSYTVASYNSQYGEWGTWSEFPQQGNGNAVIVQKGQVDEVVSDASDCSPGVTVVPPTNITSNEPIWTYAFEDNTTENDYDMNDVVIQVQEVGDQLKIMLVAAGCEYDNEVYLDGNVITFPGGITEVHKAMGSGKSQIINTGRSVVAPVAVAYIDKPYNFSHPGNFSIVPSGGNMKGKHIYVATSGYPCGLAFPCEWAWPKERVNICDAYPDFAGWATGRTSNEGWYNNPESSAVMSAK